MRKYVVFMLLAAMTAGGCTGDGESSGEEPRYQSIDTLPMLVMQIQKCSRLYTTEYRIHKIVTGKGDGFITLRGGREYSRKHEDDDGANPCD